MSGNHLVIQNPDARAFLSEGHGWRKNDRILPFLAAEARHPPSIGTARGPA